MKDDVRKKGDEWWSQETFQGEMPILIIKDSESKIVSANVMPKKGATEYTIKNTMQELNLLGYKRIIWRSDQEPALKALRDAVKTAWIGDIIPEETPVAESKSAGTVERAVRSVQGVFRSVRRSVEAKYGHKVQPEHPCIPWLVKMASLAMCRHHVGVDGKTAIERLKGRKFQRVVAEPCECIMYLVAGTRGKNKAETRWAEGIYLGVREESGEIIVGTKDGVVKSRTFRRKSSEEERWNHVQFMEMKGTPWEPVPGGGVRDVKTSIHLPAEESEPTKTETKEKEQVVKQTPISSEWIKKYGFTKGCTGCDHIKLKKKTFMHNEECRKNIKAKMKAAKDERYEAAERRYIERLGKRLDPQGEKKWSEEKPKNESTEGYAQIGGASSSASGNVQKDEVKTEEKKDNNDEGEMETEETEEDKEMLMSLAMVDDETNMEEVGLVQEFDSNLNVESEWKKLKMDFIKRKYLLLMARGRHHVVESMRKKSKGIDETSKEADLHTERMKEVCDKQNELGLHFVLEHPLFDNSWDRCKMGTWLQDNKYRCNNVGDSVIITNSCEIQKEMGAYSAKGYRRTHEPNAHSGLRNAGKMVEEKLKTREVNLEAKALLGHLMRGFGNQIRRSGRMKSGFIGMTVPEEQIKDDWNQEEDTNPEFYDNISG